MKLRRHSAEAVSAFDRPTALHMLFAGGAYSSDQRDVVIACPGALGSFLMHHRQAQMTRGRFLILC